MITREQYTARDTTDRIQSFANYMDKPTIRLLISTLPSMEHQDTIKTLLEEAHASGWANGSANTMIMMLEDAMRRKP